MRFFIFLLSFFSIYVTPSHAGVKPLALVSFAPYETLLKEIAKDTFEIQVMVPPGTSAHTYETTPKQIIEASKAEVYFSIGEPFETKAKQALKNANPALNIVDLRQNIFLLHSQCKHTHTHHTCGADLHFWLSPKILQIQAQTIASALSKQYPDKKELFETSLKKLIEKLKDLDIFLNATLAPVKNRVLMVSHPAYGYFCKDYSFTQLPIEWEGKDPTAKQLTSLLSFAKEKNVSFIFTQPQYSTKAADLMGKELRIPVISIDPYSADYDSTLRKIASLIASYP